MPRDIVQIDNALFVIATPPLEKGGAGSGNFSHSGRIGVRGGSGGGGAIHHDPQPLTRKNVSDVLQWTSSPYNTTSKKSAVEQSMKILSGDSWSTQWADSSTASEPGAETRPIEPLKLPGGEIKERVQVKNTWTTFQAGGFTTSSTMGGTEYLVNGDNMTISLGNSEFGSGINDFVASEVWHFTSNSGQ